MYGQYVVSGSWLRSFGFEPGRKIMVDVLQGQIVIKLIEAVISGVIEDALRLYFSFDSVQVWWKELEGGWMKKMVVCCNSS